MFVNFYLGTFFSKRKKVCIVCLISLHPPCFLLEISVIIKILKNPCYPINVDWFSLGWSKKKIFFWKIKFQNGRLKKRSFSSSANSEYFFSKISWIGPWVSRIDWCEGHWCGSTCMAIRLSDISSKMTYTKKAFFCCFRP